jgi:uncharacterized protein YeaO (DUF488 family)
VATVIKVKRVYDPPALNDGFRILVDRLWPRGISKEKGKIHLWLRDVAPSNELRTWYAHDPKKWEEFKKKYAGELKDKQDLLKRIKDIEKEKGIVTLVYSAKNTDLNNAVALNIMLTKT